MNQINFDKMELGTRAAAGLAVENMRRMRRTGVELTDQEQMDVIVYRSQDRWLI